MSHPLSNTLLLEASWEVCNKVGGIHTVLTSKLSHATEAFPEGYITVGPYLPTSGNAFHPETPPEKYAAIGKQLAEHGIVLHYGRWLVPGEPTTILLDWKGLSTQADSFKAMFWEQYQLDTLTTDPNDFGHPFLWSLSVGLLVEALAQANSTLQVMYHGHEWLSGSAFLYLKQQNLANVRSIFTTHATVLGRSLSGSGQDIYQILDSIEPEEEAKRHGVTAKHQLERLAAQCATIFTTVSALTGREATAFLKRTPDAITENGIDLTLFPVFDDLCIQRQQIRSILNDVVASYFFPSYQFDLNETVFQFSMGRYEAHNKGYDIYLDALGALNKKLQAEKSNKTVVAFFLIPGDAGKIRPEFVLQHTVYQRIQEKIKATRPPSPSIYANLWKNQGNNEPLPYDLPASIQAEVHDLLLHLSPPAELPVSPYFLNNEDNDPIVQGAARNNLRNSKEDRVKILFFPTYLDGFDGFFNRPLYDLVSGCDLGVFASFYEPWGYTPMESIALGIPAVTSDLAGFGLAVSDRASHNQNLKDGSFLISREGKPDTEVTEHLTTVLHNTLKETPRAWLKRRIAAYNSAEEFSWDNLYPTYLECYRKAFNIKK